MGKKGLANPLVYLILGLAVIILLGYILVSRVLHEGKSDANSILIAKAATLDLENTIQFYSEWLSNHLSAGQASTFEGLSSILISTAQVVPPTGDMVFQGWIGLHKGLIRIVFALIAWWKFWILGIAIFAIYSMKTYRVWLGKDILGQQTNGRLFYSGIRADLKKSTKNAAPDVLSPGLACAKMVSAAEAQASNIGKVLTRHGVANKTNIKLAATILAYPKWPAFIAARGEGDLLESVYSGASLAEHAALVLEAGLSLRDTYVEYSNQIEVLDDEPSSEPPNRTQMRPEDYVQELKYAFNRVLPSRWKLALAEMSAAELAAIILSNEAGKVMAYREEASRMVRGSVFPQLCSRAILHSIPDYSSDFNYYERNNIRQSIIYGSRRSVFGPVKFLVELSPQTRAARQWMELLMACPHELPEVSDEVELYGLICTLHDDWQKLFFDDLMIAPAESLSNILTHGSMMYVPFQKVMSFFRKTVDTARLKRLDVLAGIISDRQQLAIAEGIATGTNNVPDYLRIFPPLSQSEIDKICKLHSLKPEDVKDWSALRLVLNYYSWLGRRVGDNKVPDSSVIILAARRQKYDTEIPTLTSECHVGRVALRATRLIDRWGPLWSKKFDSVMTVTAVDDMQEFEKFKRGELEDDDDVPSPDGASLG
jgi:hypothetical protein